MKIRAIYEIFTLVFFALFFLWLPTKAIKRYGNSRHHKDAKLAYRGQFKGQIVLSSTVGKVKLGEVYLAGVDGLRGETGAQGPPGRKGPRGPPGIKGEKGECCRGTCNRYNSLPLWSKPCTAALEGTLRYRPGFGQMEVCSGRKWKPLQSDSKPKANRLPRRSCLDILFNGESTGDGLYWINPIGRDHTQHAFRVYCDMSTSGGGWTLVAKITDDYSWICPERNGAWCYQSTVNPAEANLFHAIHQRDTVDLSITRDVDSGIHLNNSIIRQIFVNGRQSVRFTFVNSVNDWTPSDDVYAAFNPGRANRMFVDGVWTALYRKNLDYTWNIIKYTQRSKKFSGQIICWGNQVSESYRHYDQGLHFGTPTTGHRPCHLANNENEIMLKSHYALMEGSPLKRKWDKAQFGFLGSKFVQVPFKRIALWVR